MIKKKKKRTANHHTWVAWTSKFDDVCLVNNLQINNEHFQINIPNSFIHSFPTTARLPCSVITAALRPDMNANTPDAFSGTVLFRETKPSRYTARLLLWQWKQWLNRGTDWNNPSVCPLVPQTSCLTKLNPCWCWPFRPVSLRFCLSLFSSVPFVFLPEPRSTLWVTGYWHELFVFPLAESNVHSHCEEEEKSKGRSRRVEKRKQN